MAKPIPMMGYGSPAGTTVSVGMFGTPIVCDRGEYLRQKDLAQARMNTEVRCHKINTRPGYEVLTKMKYSGG